MNLQLNVSRCAGERTEPHGERRVCERRDSCARYIDRFSGRIHTLGLCADDGRLSAFIPLSALIKVEDE